MQPPQFKACPQCQCPAQLNASHCSRCGHMYMTQFGQPYQQQMYGPNPYAPQASNKLAAGLCAIFLGGFGVHKFILGYTNEGITMLLISLVGGLFTCGIASMVIHVIGIVEGVIYLTKSDQDFVNTYVARKQGWF